MCYKSVIIYNHWKRFIILTISLRWIVIFLTVNVKWLLANSDFTLLEAHWETIDA